MPVSTKDIKILTGLTAFWRSCAILDLLSGASIIEYVYHPDTEK